MKKAFIIVVAGVFFGMVSCNDSTDVHVKSTTDTLTEQNNAADEMSDKAIQSSVDTSINNLGVQPDSTQ
jgi:hypothetical protein